MNVHCFVQQNGRDRHAEYWVQEMEGRCLHGANPRNKKEPKERCSQSRHQCRVQEREPQLPIWRENGVLQGQPGNQKQDTPDKHLESDNHDNIAARTCPADGQGRDREGENADQAQDHAKLVDAFRKAVPHDERDATEAGQQPQYPNWCNFWPKSVQPAKATIRGIDEAMIAASGASTVCIATNKRPR